MNSIHDMMALAKKTILHSYSPYSHFPVACVVKTQSGQLFCGVNMENAAYPEGVCAEGTALGAMVTAGERVLVEVLVLASKNFNCFPCGGCRQRLSEFSSAQTLVHIANEAQGHLETKTMGELFPHCFTVDNLKEK